jgi:DNA-binding transcriptional MocR family regulator
MHFMNSRWLLQARDLLRSDTLPLTQEFLSQMLGVQRSSVTLVASKLQEAGLINYRRGRIHILDVEGLQDSCCECYKAVNGNPTMNGSSVVAFTQSNPATAQQAAAAATATHRRCGASQSPDAAPTPAARAAPATAHGQHRIIATP